MICKTDHQVPPAAYLRISAERLLRRLILGVIGMQGRPLPEQVADEVPALAKLFLAVVAGSAR
jgi:hypothetical protein